MAGKATDAMRASATRFGARAFLEKPLDLEALLAAIEAAGARIVS